MQVNETRTPAQGRAPEAGPTARFAAALRSARDAAARRQAAAGTKAMPVPPLVVRRAATARVDVTLRARREVFRDEERHAPAAPASIPPGRPISDPPPVSELRAVLRALPPAIDASGVRDGAPLTLAFGRSLSVDVRASASGVELLLRADARLARAAQAELPGLVAALRSRGIRVARADVAPRAHEGPATRLSR
jgi:hypothetical protein